MALYYDSPEFHKLQEELKKKDEDEDYRQDTDPKGFALYKKIVNIYSLLQ